MQNCPEDLLKDFLALPEEQQRIVKEILRGYKQLPEEQQKLLIQRMQEDCKGKG